MNKQLATVSLISIALTACVDESSKRSGQSRNPREKQAANGAGSIHNWSIGKKSFSSAKRKSLNEAYWNCGRKPRKLSQTKYNDCMKLYLAAPPPISVSRGIAKSTVMDVALNNYKTIKDCYLKHLATNNKPWGWTEFIILVARSGKVISAEKGKSTFHHLATENCFRQGILKWTFPRMSVNTARVHYPIEIKPKCNPCAL